MSTEGSQSISAKRSSPRKFGWLTGVFGIRQTIALTKPMTEVFLGTLDDAKKILRPPKAPAVAITFEDAMAARGATDADVADALRYQNCRALVFIVMATFFFFAACYMAWDGAMVAMLVHTAFAVSCVAYGSIALYRSSQLIARSYAQSFSGWLREGRWMNSLSLDCVLGKASVDKSIAPRP